MTLNDHILLDETWAGRWVSELTAAVPVGSLVNGTNSVRLGAQVMPGNDGDYLYVNYWELDYRRLFRAWEAQFDFHAEVPGLHEYVVGNWATKWVAIWDVSNADQPRNLTYAEATPDGASAFQLRFRTNDGTGARYWLQEEAAFQPPASIRVQNPTGLRDQALGADTVIVTPADFLPAAQTVGSMARGARPACRRCGTARCVR